jgi:Transposase DDE domain.
LSDTLGRPIVLQVTAGNVSDITMAEALLAEIKECRHVLADKGYDSDKLRKTIRSKGGEACHPRPKITEKGDPLRQTPVQIPMDGRGRILRA